MERGKPLISALSLSAFRWRGCKLVQLGSKAPAGRVSNPDRLPSMGLWRVKRDWATELIHVISGKLFGRVQFSATPRTVACQAPLSMGILQARYWSGLPCHSPESIHNRLLSSVKDWTPNLGVSKLERLSNVLEFLRYYCHRQGDMRRGKKGELVEGGQEFGRQKKKKMESIEKRIHEVFIMRFPWKNQHIKDI